MSLAPGALIIKDPQSNEPYGLDWSAWLAELGDAVTIATSAWSVAPSSLTLSAASIVTGALKTQVRLAGGDVGTHYTVTNHIIATDGSIDDRSFRVLVQDR